MFGSNKIQSCRLRYIDIDELMRPIWGWPTAPHPTYKSYVTLSIWQLHAANGPIYLVRLVEKEICSAQTSSSPIGCDTSTLMS
eukprot:scaffold10087_cov74-Skeletonema_menzelii.AAC.1